MFYLTFCIITAGSLFGGRRGLALVFDDLMLATPYHVIKTKTNWEIPVVFVKGDFQFLKSTAFVINGVIFT